MKTDGYWELFRCIRNNPIKSLSGQFSRDFNNFIHRW